MKNNGVLGYLFLEDGRVEDGRIVFEPIEHFYVDGMNGSPVERIVYTHPRWAVEDGFKPDDLLRAYDGEWIKTVFIGSVPSLQIRDGI